MMGERQMNDEGHFRALDHVGFAVSELDRSVAFYEQLLGVSMSRRGTWDQPYTGVMVGYPGATIEVAFFELPGGVVLKLLEYKAPHTGTVDMESYNVGNAHLCLITEDIDADFARMRAAGYDDFRTPLPVEIPWGPNKGRRVCYLRDPDGISIELMEARQTAPEPGREAGPVE